MIHAIPTLPEPDVISSTKSSSFEKVLINNSKISNGFCVGWKEWLLPKDVLKIDVWNLPT